MRVNKLLLSHDILRGIKNRSVTHNHVSRAVGVRRIHIELNAGGSTPEIGRGKTPVLVGAGNRKFIGDQRRRKVMPSTRGETEDLLIRSTNVMAVSHPTGVIVARYSPRFSRICTGPVGVYPGVAEIMKIGE